MKILLVDDSQTMRNIQKRCLDQLGEPVQVAEAKDGVEALTVIASHGATGFDLVVVDWNMPNMDGLTLVKSIRAKDRGTPLLMCTTEAEKSRVLEAIKAGVNNYVVKPFVPETLVTAVKTTVAKAVAAKAA